MSTPNLSDSALGLALEQYKQGNLEQAQQLFLNVLNIDERNPDALYFMALIDHQSGRPEVAENRASDLLMVKPGDAKALNLLGSILMSQGRLEEASARFAEGIKSNEKDPMLLVNAAICEIGQGNPDASIEYCKRALKYSPDYANAYNILGNAWLGKSEFDKAAEAFSRALEKQPEFTEANFNLGRALLEAGKPDDAMEQFETVLSRMPEHVHALTCKADVFAGSQRLNEAEELYQHVIETNPNHAPAHTGLGRLYRLTGRLDDALALFKQAIELNPNNIDALMFAGETFRKMGNHQAAVAAFQDVLRIDPDNAQARFHLATVDSSATPAKPEPGYIRKLFDEFAGTFNETLNSVGYNGPEQLLEIAGKHLPEDVAGNLDILDLGCGTGLSGIKFSKLAKTMKGIDLSPKMVEAARATGVYDDVEVNELLGALVHHQNDTDIALAADTFPYIGDLESVFLAVTSALREKGLFLFCVETHDDPDDYKLSSTARYSHSDNYIKQLADRRKLEVLSCERTSYREESGKPVDGLIVALRKSG